jgi:hypothetical protein
MEQAGRSLELGAGSGELLTFTVFRARQACPPLRWLHGCEQTRRDRHPPNGQRKRAERISASLSSL